MTHHQAPPPPSPRTTHIAEIEDPITGETTRLEAPTAEELDQLIEVHTADPNSVD